MMNASILRDYFDDRVKSLKENYSDLNKKNDEGIIHHLRVDIKKIKFSLFLIGRYHPDFNAKKLYKTFKKIFKQAGEIRDADIKQELLEKYFGKEKVKELEEKLEKSEQKIQHHLHDKINAYKSAVNKAKKKTEKELGELPRISQAEYANQLQKEIKTCFHKDMKDEDLHPSRKLLKEVVYASKLNKSMDYHLRSKKLDPQKLKDLEKQIGSWHDKVVFREWLDQDEPYFSIQPQNQKALEKLNRDMKADSEQIHSRISELIGTCQ